ncbi:hypothetical protein PSACC_03047 [Paramicrosporidium saccamoebae]|uniref:RRM domain-containing protein n=1 Tax=Paramicrosporidium saccamoebae TaxID=1246581 RepID=A0A2H9THC0_9FUNG|nr:hypothetical protein PSACC_03047 [Paramicrosporidium saccamoebae]
MTTDSVAVPTVASTKKRRDGGTHTKTTIFIPKLPSGASGKELEEMFSEWGAVRSAFTVKKGDGCIGFVHFALSEDAKRALETVSKGVPFKGKTIVGELALRKNASKDEKPAQDPVKAVPVKKSPVLLMEISEGKESFDKKQLYKKVRKSGNLKELIYPVEGNIHCAKLVFTNSFEAEKALAKLDQHTFKGRKFTVTAAPAEVKSTLKMHRLIVRNLAFSAKKSTVEAAFSPHGTVVEVTIPTKPGSKIMRGFAFVQMNSKEEAQMALDSLNGTEIAGRVVAVDWAVDKTTFQKLNVESPVLKEDEEVDVEDEEVDIEDKEMDVENSDEEVDVENSDEEVDVEEESEMVDNLPDNPLEIPSPNTDLGTTVFIRNVAFVTEEEDLAAALEAFGALEYVKIVRDSNTGATKGTAFAKFKQSSAAKAACEASEQICQTQLEAPVVDPSELEQSLTTVSSKLEQLARKRTGKDFKSIVETGSAIVTDDQSKGIIVDGRALSVLPAIDRKTAVRMKKEGGFLDSGPQDRRNLYLLNETALKPKTTLAKRFWPTIDVSYREQLLKERRKELKDNHNVFVSPTRLSLRHLPTSVDATDVKRVLRTAIERALALVEGDEGYPMIDDKLLPSLRPHLKQVKIIRGERERSKGYAFAEFSHPVHSLLVVRYLANYAPGLWRELLDKFQGSRHREAVFRAKAPVVEFATEKMSIVNKRAEAGNMNESAVQKSVGTTNRGARKMAKPIDKAYRPKRSKLQ